MPTKVIASASPDEPGTAQLTWEHPLAAVAARNCQKHSTALEDLLGLVACGSCWADALFTDYMFAVENDLPLDRVSDPSYVDDVAVERAVHEVRYAVNRAAAEQAAFDSLTEVERAEAKRRLTAIRNRRNQKRSYRFVCSKAAAARREVQR